MELQILKKTSLIILPYGSGNDFSKGFDCPLNLKASDLLTKILESWKPCKCDYILVNKKHKIINSCTMGISSSVLKLRESMKIFGPKIRYKIASVIKGVGYKNYLFKYKIDDGPWEIVDSHFIYCQNSKYVGGGMLTSTKAKINDGLLGFSILHKFLRIKILSIIGKYNSDKTNKIKEHEERQIKKVEFDFQFNGFSMLNLMVLLLNCQNIQQLK